MQQRLHNLILKRFQPIRRARREVAGVTFCARTFQKPAHYFCYCPTGPGRGAGREAPPRGCLLYGATLERLYDCVLACRVVSRGHVPLYAIVATSCPSCPSCPSVVPVRRAWSCMAAAAVAAWFLCRSRVVATRRQMLAFAMVLMASHYPDLHNKSVVCIVKPCQPVERSAQQGAAAITEPPLATGLIPVR